MPFLPAGYEPRATRSERRKISRDHARQQTSAMHHLFGTTPLVMPADDGRCRQHHRRFPCARCTK